MREERALLLRKGKGKERGRKGLMVLLLGEGMERKGGGKGKGLSSPETNFRRRHWVFVMY